MFLGDLRSHGSRRGLAYITRFARLIRRPRTIQALGGNHAVHELAVGSSVDERRCDERFHLHLCSTRNAALNSWVKYTRSSAEVKNHKGELARCLMQTREARDVRQPVARGMGSQFAQEH